MPAMHAAQPACGSACDPAHLHRRHACRDIAPTLRLGEHLGARAPSGGPERARAAPHAAPQVAPHAAHGWTRAYAAHLLGMLERQLIAPFCLSAETDLRLSNHASQAAHGDKAEQAEKPQARLGTPIAARTTDEQTSPPCYSRA